MRADAHGDHQIAGGTAVVARAAFSADAKRLTVVDAGGKFDRDLVAAADFALALAAAAWRADNLAGTAAVRAGSSGLHGHTHKALLCADTAGTLAALAGFDTGAGRGAGAAALVAVFDAARGDFLFRTESGFLKCNLHARAHVVATDGCIGAAAGRASAAAEEAAEQVAQIAEVAEACTAEGVAGIRIEVGIYARKAKLVIACALFRIGQYLVCLVDLLEALDGVRLVVHIRMIFGGQLAVGLFDIGFGRVLGNAQNLIVISLIFVCHNVTFLAGDGLKPRKTGGCVPPVFTGSDHQSLTSSKSASTTPSSLPPLLLPPLPVGAPSCGAAFLYSFSEMA